MLSCRVYTRQQSGGEDDQFSFCQCLKMFSRLIIGVLLILLKDAHASKIVKDVIATSQPIATVEPKVRVVEPDPVVASGLDPESTTESSETQTTISSTTQVQITTMLTTQALTTTTATPTTQRHCPQSQLLTQESYRTLNHYSRQICPEIDINIGNGQLQCFRVYKNGYVKEKPAIYYYFPSRNFFSQYGSWIFAPYMADLDNRGPNSRVKYSTYSKYTYNGLASDYVRDKLVEIDKRINSYTPSWFQSVWAIVITWENVRSRNLQGESWTNYPGITFQMVLVTNGYQTYLLYLYQPCKMDMNIDMTSLMGYAGGGKYYIYKDSLKTNSLVNIDFNGNTGKEGAWLFDISGRNVQTNKLKCLKWYAHAWYVPLRDWCPCNDMEAGRDFRFINNGGMTYTSIFTGRICRYSRTWRWGYPLRYGITQQYSLFFDFVQWHVNDWEPFNTCRNVRLFWLYTRKRPLDYCQGYRFPWFAWTFGDPHIQTFDGFKYSFNGLGEYVYLDIYNKTNNVKLIEIQARTQLATNENGTTVNATIFSAFAMKDFQTNATAQVEMSVNKKELSILCGEKDLTTDFKKDPKFQKIGSISVIRKSNETQDPTASFTFKSGIDLTVSISTEMLSVSLSIPEDVKETITTSGLQGYIDGDPSNDLRMPNGTVLSVNATEEEIFHNFGQLWLIKDSLFKYPAGQTKNDYIDESFRPLFLNKTSPKYTEAVKVCEGEANIACIYDFIATENKALAAKTRSVAKVAKEELLLTSNHPPVINGSDEIRLNVNESVVWQLSVTDQDNDDVRLVIQDGSEYINMTGSGYNFSLTIRLPALELVNISVIAIDSKNRSSGEFPLKVILCSGCSGNGNCSADDVEIEEEYYEQLQCTCYTGYDGANCNQDADGCSENPCVEKKYCTDLTPKDEVALGRSFNCSCPAGFKLENDNRCSDIDECKNGNPCDQTCINTEGSFRCKCKDGYELKKETKCININECLRKTDTCQHECNDTIPGYTCSCYAGFKLNADNSTCDKENVTISCSVNCDNAAGCADNKCFCNNGFDLSPNNTCIDTDECLKSPCDGTCKNTNGSYYCECPFGKKLVDRTKCEECGDDFWGQNCGTPCNCSNNAASCDPMTGCVCQDGWNRKFCAEDIDECNGDNECTKRETCVNKPGTYECQCLAGYEKEGDVCVDINECNIEGKCPYACENSDGSFACKCATGYKGENGINCTDVDECAANIHGCEQECVNNEGSFSCNCKIGYKLYDDRKTCNLSTESEECKAANCTANEYCYFRANETTKCVCKNGYEYDNSANTCTQIDLCKSNPCQNGTCLSNINEIICLCEDGFYQKGATCTPCSSIKWGPKCANTCNCLKGRCDHVIGCVCDVGYIGKTCNQPEDFCANNATCDATSTCKSLETNHTCECKTGYTNGNRSTGNCTECDSNHWGENCLKKCDCVNGACNHTSGCVCTAGYRGIYCDERIDYCKNNTCDATSTCKLMQSDYICECKDGYFNSTSKNGSCQVCPTGRWGEQCSNPCNCVNGTCDREVGCECSPGYFGRLCDGNYCTNNNCDQTSTCKLLTTNYTCICKTGYHDPTLDIGNCTRDMATTTQIYTSADTTTYTQAITYITTDSQTNATVTVTTEPTTKLQTTTTVPEAYFRYQGLIVLNETFPATPEEIKSLKESIIVALTAEFIDSVPGFVGISNVVISNGSVVVNYTLGTNKDAQEAISKQMAKIGKDGLVINNKRVSVISTQTIQCIKGCTVTADNNFYLALGLGLGIPALIIFIAIIVICVWFRRRNDFAAQRLNESDVSNVQQAFGSVSSIFTRKNVPVNQDFLGPTRFRAWENDEPLSQTSFYLHNALSSPDTFRIKRPKLY